MLSADQARRALIVVTSAAVAKASREVSANPAATRDRLAEAVPQVVGTYSLGSAALAADYYDARRDEIRPPKSYRAEPVVDLRAERLRRGLLWSTEPLWSEDPDVSTAKARLAGVIQFETARAFRETITTNTRRDPSSLGWRRVASGGCSFCRMLADKGAIFRAETARFAAHTNCNCSAEPVFQGEPVGEQASVLQYQASQKRRTPEQKKKLREYLNAHY